MKYKNSLHHRILTSMALMAFGFGLFWLVAPYWYSGSHSSDLSPAELDTSVHTQQIASPSDSDDGAYYCPMHPHIIGEQGDSCPICSMSLVAPSKSSPRAHHAGLGATGESKIYATEPYGGVISVEVANKELAPEVYGFGRVALDPELYKAQSEYLELVSSLKGSSYTQIRRAAHLRLQSMGLSRQHIRDLRRSGQPERALLTSQGSDTIVVYAYVREEDLHVLSHTIRPGTSADIELPRSLSHHLLTPSSSLVKVQSGAFSSPDTGRGDGAGTEEFLGRVLIGHVAYIDTITSPATGMVKVRLSVPAHSSLRSGSAVTVRFKPEARSYAAVPYDAVFRRGGRSYVFVRGDGGYLLTPVQVILLAGNHVAIAEDELVGSHVARYSQFLLDADTRLKSLILGGSSSSGLSSGSSPSSPSAHH